MIKYLSITFTQSNLAHSPLGIVLKSENEKKKTEEASE